jgi:hypothetical protein
MTDSSNNYSSDHTYSHKSGQLSLFFLGVMFSPLVYIDQIIPVCALLFIYTTLSSLTLYNTHRNFVQPSIIVMTICAIYSMVFPIYFSLGGERIANVSRESVLLGLKYSYVFMFVFTNFGVFFRKNNFYALGQSKIKFSKFSLWAVFLFFSCIFLPALIGVDGNISKAERMTEGVSVFQSFFGGILLPFSLIQVYSLEIKRKFEKVSLILVICVGIVGFIALGERDMLLHPIIICVVIYGFFFQPGIIKILISAFTVIFILYVMGLVRTYTESGIARPTFSLLMILQENEFISSARNLSVIIDNGIPNANTFLGDILYPFGVNAFPTGSMWFSDNFYENKGFGIIAEGVVNSEFFGVIFVSIIMSSILHFIYLRSFNSMIYRSIYPIVIIGALYALRSDLASLTSAGVRKILIPLAIIFILDRLLKKKLII